MNKTEALIYQRTLRACNTIRKKRGMEALTELPQGRPGKTGRCPVANACRRTYLEHIRVTRQTVGISYSDGSYLAWDLPKSAQEFIKRFDEGHYPELEAC